MHNNNIDLKQIWKQQEVAQPDIEKLLAQAKQFKRSGLQNIIVLNILLAITTLFILLIAYYFQPKFVSTKTGIILVILAMVMYLFAYNKLFAVFNKISPTLSNNEYLHTLSTLKQKQKHMQTSMMNLYFALLGSGICLYLYEYALLMKPIGAILTYTLTLGWIGFNWFYIRPRVIKKQQARLDELIKKFEAVKRQL